MILYAEGCIIGPDQKTDLWPVGSAAPQDGPTDHRKQEENDMGKRDNKVAKAYAQTMARPKEYETAFGKAPKLPDTRTAGKKLMQIQEKELYFRKAVSGIEGRLSAVIPFPSTHRK